DDERRAAVGVLNGGLLALRDELLDLGDVAARGGVVQPGIDAQLTLARRRLRPRSRAGSKQSKTADNNTKQASHHGCTEKLGSALVWRFRSSHHSCGESDVRTSEPKPH